MNYIQHPIGQMMPHMSDEKYLEIKEDVKKNGFTQPIITLYQGKILDGWHRAKIADELGIEIQTIEYVGDSPATFVQSNSNRRDLTPSQKAYIAVKMLPLIEKEAQCKKIRTNVNIGNEGTRLSLTKNKRPLQSRDIVGKMNKVSGKAVQIAKKAEKEMPEIFEKMKEGKITVKQVKNELYKKKESEKKSTIDIEIKNDDIKLHNCDISDSLIPNNSINAIICDPPYPRGYLNCWTKLAKFANDKLVDGGVLIAMSGQSYLPDVYKNMTVEGLNYYWTCAIHQPKVPTILQNKRLNCFWKPLLIYVKGEYKGTFQPSDFYVSDYKDTKKGKEYHDWGQNYEIFSKLVNDWTYSNDVICDPFLGGGTTAIACIRNKRKFVGIEISKEAFNVAKQRISEELKNGN